MPLKYTEPKRWNKKQEINIPFWNKETKKTVEKIIDEIPERAESKIKVQILTKIKIGKKTKKIKRNRERCEPVMGRLEYDIFKAFAGDKTPEGASVKIKIFWNDRQSDLKKREEKILKEFSKTFKKQG
jgi:hypothetical protein